MHSNIGGSYRNTGLSDIALKWLADRAAHHGLKFTRQFISLQPLAADKGRLEDSCSVLYRVLRFLASVPTLGKSGLNNMAISDVRDASYLESVYTPAPRPPSVKHSAAMLVPNLMNPGT